MYFVSRCHTKFVMNVERVIVLIGSDRHLIMFVINFADNNNTKEGFLLFTMPLLPLFLFVGLVWIGYYTVWRSSLF